LAACDIQYKLHYMDRIAMKLAAGWGAISKTKPKRRRVVATTYLLTTGERMNVQEAVLDGRNTWKLSDDTLRLRLLDGDLSPEMLWRKPFSKPKKRIPQVKIVPKTSAQELHEALLSLYTCQIGAPSIQVRLAWTRAMEKARKALQLDIQE
jgi:hypothetical protein